MISNDIVNNIRDEIAAKITANSTLFGSVYAYPRTTLDGFPSVFVMPSENLADYGSTAENRFTFVFTLHVYYPITKESEQEQSERAVGRAVGELLRIFSQRGILDSCLWVQPIPTVWGDETLGEAVYRTALVTLRCVTYPLVD
jgi:hypothetical protein